MVNIAIERPNTLVLGYAVAVPHLCIGTSADALNPLIYHEFYDFGTLKPERGAHQRQV